MPKPPPIKRGPAIARVTFRRYQDMIKAELDEGWSALAIYTRHQDELRTISYRQFLRYAAPLRQPMPSSPTHRQKQPQPEDARPANAGHQSSLSRTFNFEAEAKPGERAQLIGPPRNKPK